MELSKTGIDFLKQHKEDLENGRMFQILKDLPYGYEGHNIIAFLVEAGVDITEGMEILPQDFWQNIQAVTSFTIPSYVKEIGETPSLSHLKEITIESNAILPKNFLADYPNLETVRIEGHQSEIPSLMCDNCPNLKDVYLPETITSIGLKAFNDCPNVVIHMKGNHKVKIRSLDAEFLKQHITKK